MIRTSFSRPFLFSNEALRREGLTGERMRCRVPGMELKGWLSIFRFIIVGVVACFIIAIIPWPVTIDSFSTAITILVTVGGALLAIEGLSAWKRQLHGKTDHDIAWVYLE